MEVIEWRVRSYEDITITEGTGLLFSWEGTHDLLELSSAVSSPRDCQDFAGPKAKDLGKVCVFVCIMYKHSLLRSTLSW